MAQDAAEPGFWEQRYRAGETPWTAPEPPAELQELAAATPGTPRVLIPGCGAGREPALLAARGWDVLAIDFSASAVEQARQRLGEQSATLRQADFFSFDEPAFDVVYERAFLCALPPRMRSAYAARMAEVVVPRGLLCGYFLVGERRGGPPYFIEQPDLDALIEPSFTLEEDRRSVAPLAIFDGAERWMVWRRRAAGRSGPAPD